MRYFISCSGGKSSISKQDAASSNLKALKGFPELYEARKELINLLGIQLNWNQTLPAYKLYNGRVFKKVSLENWTKRNAEIIIVSALFGLIKHDEFLPNYNLIMTDKLPRKNALISSYWKNKNIARFVSKETDVDLLFSKYRKAFNIKGNSIATEPNVLWRDKYGSHKGEWLNEQLNQL